MGKRSAFERIERDFYPTPESAVVPLLPHLQPGTLFAEPCAGEGDLVRHLVKFGHVCSYSGDIKDGQDALKFGAVDCDNIITNSPWEWSILRELIEHFCRQRPTWLLLPADFKHNKRSAQFGPWCRKVVSVGRVKWIADSESTGKDNCAWYLFDAKNESETVFVWRRAA